MRPVALALCIVLAGCATEATDQVRNDDLVITIQSAVPFRIALPLPIDDVTSTADWEGALRLAHGSSPAMFHVAPSAEGDLLWIEGNGTVLLEGRLARMPGCCADSFHEGTWTTEPDGHPMSTLRVFVETGQLQTLSLHYEAASCVGRDCDDNGPHRQVCSHLFDAGASGLLPGWMPIAVRTDDFRCSAPP